MDSMYRRVRLYGFGDPDVLKIEEFSLPEPGNGLVRIKVKAIGLNRTEITFRSGRSPAKPVFPTQIGFEAAGEIDAVGPDIVGYAVGDRVAVIPAYGVADFGFYGEYTLAPARSLVKVPASVTWEEAAATWVAFATAWSGLVDIAGLSSDQVVLIPAASSSVGLAAIQVAVKAGAVPIALTRTSRKAEALRQAGAQSVIVTEEQEIVPEVMRLTQGKGADLVFDSVAGPTFAQLAEATAVGGKLVIFGSFSREPTPLPVLTLLSRRLSVFGFGLPTTTKDDFKLKALKSFVEQGLSEGSLHPTIAKVFSFEDIVNAHRYLELGDQIGKVVVSV